MKYLLMVSMLMLGACASLKVDKDQTQNVKRVAIVGFDVQQQRPVEMGDLFKVATHQDASSKAEVKGRSEAEHVAKMYNNLRQKLETENHWQVMSLDSVKANAAYQALFKDKTEGFQNRPIINDRYNLLQPAGILDSFAIRTTEADKLKQLQAALGVDALLVVGMTVNLNNSSMFASLIGQGKFQPYAITNAYMLQAKSNEQIWVDSNVKGEPVDNDEKNFMGLANEDKINQMAVMAADSSYNKLISNYKEKLAQ